LVAEGTIGVGTAGEVGFDGAPVDDGLVCLLLVVGAEAVAAAEVVTAIVAAESDFSAELEVVADDAEAVVIALVVVLVVGPAVVVAVGPGLTVAAVEDLDGEGGGPV